MAYGVSHFSEPQGVADHYQIASAYRQVPLWQYLGAFLAVVILHGVALSAFWMPAQPVTEAPVPLRMIARTILLAPPVSPPKPDIKPVNSSPSKPAAVAKPAPPLPPKQTPLQEKTKVESTLTSVVAPPVKRPPITPMPTAPRKAPPVSAAPVNPAHVKDAPIKEGPIKDTLIKETPIKEAPVSEVPAQFGVAYLQNPAPAYPMLSRRRREQGTVQLQVWVTAAGTAAKVEILQSSGFARLDEAAQATVKGWRFVPARRGGVPVASTVKVPIVFALN